MFAFSRVFLVVFLAAPLLAPGSARAQGYPLPYARMLPSNEVRDVLHCPWCNYAELETDGSIYVVRTAERLNLAFADPITARHAAELLNMMASAKNQCARAQYDLALEEYAELSLRDDRTGPGWDEGGFKVLNPQHDLSSLAEYVLPPFRACRTHRVARAKASPDRAYRSGLRWSKR
jgi:hypothetical protein